MRENRYQVCSVYEKINEIYKKYDILLSERTRIILAKPIKNVWPLLKEYRVNRAYTELEISEKEWGKLFQERVSRADILDFNDDLAAHRVNNQAQLDIYTWFKLMYRIDQRRVLKEFFPKLYIENEAKYVGLEASMVWELFVAKNQNIYKKIEQYYHARDARNGTIAAL
jgi:hypothetical protein